MKSRLSVRSHVWSWLFALGAILITPCVWALPPLVVYTVPADNETEVDPSLTELRVEFDQDMIRNSHSWVGNGPNFPRTRGNPYWESKRICVLPVELDPNYEYVLSLNGERAMGFKNQNHEPLLPVALRFTTGAGAGGPSDMPGEEENGRAIAALRRAIDEKYSYRDLRGVDWDRVFKANDYGLRNAASPREFAEQTAKMLTVAKDAHVRVVWKGISFGTQSRDFTPNFNYETLPRRIRAWQRRSPIVTTGLIDNEIGYILISGWGRDVPDGHEPAFEALEVFGEDKMLVVDVRPNGGGDEGLAQHFAGCFIDWPAVYAKHVYRAIDKPGGFTKPSHRLLKPKRGRPKYRGKVAVLMGPACMSSCEAFLLMMKKTPNCKLVGLPSYGCSGVPKPNPLPNGVSVILPTWKAMRPDDSFFEGEGIAPDIRVETTKEDFNDGDPVLEAALEWLRSEEKEAS